jgi:integrase
MTTKKRARYPYIRVAECIYKRGNRFYLDFKHDGRRERRKLAVKTLDEAKHRRDEARANVDRVALGQAVMPEAQTVREVLDARVLMVKNSIAPKTYRRYEEHVEKISAILGGLDVRTLTPKDIRRYSDHRINEGMSGKTINNELQFLHSAIMDTHAPDVFRDKAFRNGWKLPENDEEGKEYTVAEMDAVTRESVNQTIRTMIIVARYTGCRIGELIQVRKRDINIVTREITFRAESTKGKRGTRRTRNVPIHPIAFDAINIFMASHESPMIFPDDRDATKELTINRAVELWRQTWEHAGVIGRFHDLRHTFITQQLRAGVPMKQVALLVGHKSTRMIEQRYGHLTNADASEALRRSWAISDTSAHSSPTQPNIPTRNIDVDTLKTHSLH